MCLEAVGAVVESLPVMRMGGGICTFAQDALKSTLEGKRKEKGCKGHGFFRHESHTETSHTDEDSQRVPKVDSSTESTEPLVCGLWTASQSELWRSCGGFTL